MLSIGAFSRLSQVSIKTLRFYHEIGLFKPAHVDRFSGYRYYLPRQLNDLRSILGLKEMGFSLEEIEVLLRENTSGERLRDRLVDKRLEIEATLNEANEQIHRIEVALNLIEGGAEFPTPRVSLKRVAPQLVASLRDTVPNYETAGLLFDELSRFVKQNGERGILGAVWHKCLTTGNSIDCEALVFLSEPLKATKRVRVYELPAVTVASAVHQGDADFSASYSAANGWIAANNLRRNGPNREIYLEGGYLDHESAVMEIQFPVEARPAL